MAGTQQGWRTLPTSGGGGVLSVSGLDTDNSDPANPIVKISVDGSTITGDGTPASPLQSNGVQSVTGLDTDNSDPENPIVKISVDGLTITGNGTPVSPLQASSNTNRGFYSQTSQSATIVNSNLETSLIGAGVGNLSVPPNTFNIGDSFVARMGGEISNLNNTNITFRIESALIPIVDTGLIQLKQGTNQFWELVIYFTIRNIGGLGVASIISNGNFVHIRNNTGIDFFGFNTIDNTTFDTTIINTLDITAQWQTASASNSIHSDYFCLNKIY